MCLEKPPQIGALVIRSKHGRLEHLKGDGKNARFRAYKYVLDAQGEPTISEVYKSGLTDDIRAWFREWSIEASIEETMALSVSARMDRLKDQIKEAKANTMAKPETVTVNLDVSDLVDVLLSIDETLDKQTALLNQISKKMETVLKPTVVSVKAETIEAAKTLAEKKQTPRSATEVDVKAFLDGVNVLDVVNTKTQYLNTKFIDWCHSKEIKPCTSTMLTKHACKVLGLLCVNGMFRPQTFKKAGEA